MNSKNVYLQEFLDSITVGSNADITVLDSMNMVVASSAVPEKIGLLYDNPILIYEATEVLVSSTDKKDTFLKDGKTVLVFKYSNERFYAVFGENTDCALINLFMLYFSEKGVHSQEVGGVSGMFYEVLAGTLNVSATIDRADRLGFDFLSKCTPLLLSTNEDNHDVGLAIDEFVNSVDENSRLKIMLTNTEIVLIYINVLYEEVVEEAYSLLEMIEAECAERCVIGIGSQANNVFELANIYKELSLAVKVDPVFDGGKYIISLEEYSIGRLIRELDEDTCKKFVDEVMGDFQEEYDKEDYFSTINTFFKCNLNSSEAAREMFIHRNTLIYRLGKIKKMTGYDITNFDEAFVFKWATMLYKYLRLKSTNKDLKPLLTDDARKLDEY